MFSIISAQQSFIISLNLNFNEEKVYWFKTNKKKKHTGIPPSTTLSILDAKEEPTAAGHELPEGHLVWNK